MDEKTLSLLIENLEAGAALSSTYGRGLARAWGLRHRPPHEQQWRREAQAIGEPAELLATVLPARDSYFGRPTWCVKLRVQRGKATYVIKNIAALVDAYRMGSVVTYGKNLSFAHMPAAFSERARQLLVVLARVVASQQALFLSRRRYQEAGRGADIKELPVSEADLVDLLDALQGATLSFEPQDYGARARQLRVIANRPPVRTELVVTEDGGLDLRLHGASDCFSAGERLYVPSETHARSCPPEYAAQAGLLLRAPLSEQGAPRNKAPHIGPKVVPTFCRDVLPTLLGGSE